MFSGEVKNNSEHSVGFQELAMIRSAVKSGNGRLGKTKRFGSVFAHHNYYLFEFNEDHSITIKNVLDPEIDSGKIEMYEEEFGSGRSRNGKITIINPWSQLVRSRQGRGIFDNAGSSQQTASSGSTYVMDGGQSKGINSNGRGRSIDDNFSKGDGDSRGKASLEIKPIAATPEKNTLVLDVQDSVRTAVREELNRMGEEYGWIPKGEKAVRDVRLPKKTEEDKYVSRTVRTILEAEATPEDVLPTIEEMVANGEFSYDKYTDKEAMADAERELRTRGWDKEENSGRKGKGKRKLFETKIRKQRFWCNTKEKTADRNGTAVFCLLFKNIYNSFFSAEVYAFLVSVEEKVDFVSAYTGVGGNGFAVAPALSVGGENIKL